MQKYNFQTDATFLEKQVEPLFRSTLSGGLGNIFSAFLIYLFLYGSKQESTALILSIIIIFLSLIRIYISKHYFLHARYKLENYVHAHVFLTLLTGIVWGIFAYMQLDSDDESLRNLVILVNFGLIAGSIATLSTWMIAYLAFMIPQAIAIFYVFINLDNEFSMQMATAVVIFMAIMIITSNRFNVRLKKELELIDDLNNEIHVREKIQFELEDNKRKLESTVMERTRDLVDTNTSLQNVIEKKEKAEQSLQYLAYHDELTGLPNRALLIDRINHSIEIADRSQQQIGILFLDLDRFKSINDSLGHTVGDNLIKEVANRLLHTLRKEDTISRNGGDEFVVVIQRMHDINESIGIAQKLIENLMKIFEIDSHKIHIGASIGISVYPNDGDNALELLRNADTAMYSSKMAGGNQMHFYDESMSNRLRERLVIESELHAALSRNEFYMVYQPQVDCRTGKTVGFEALLRWNNEKLGSISPCQFIPLLEETGLIYEVGEWVINNVIEFHQSGSVGDALIAINLSTLQCGNLELVDHIDNRIKKAGIDPSKIEFEITESILINDFEQTEKFLNRLHDIGCSIALDDFGTGYTSMSYLTRLPIDIIKVDQTFIMGVDKSKTLKTIVKAIINMSVSLGIRNIFEGVETEAELAVVKELDGVVIQGYLYSKPLQVDDIDSWLNDTHMICHG